MVLMSYPTPDNAETYFSPVIYVSKNGTSLVVIGTGGETHSGGLYVIQMEKLYKGQMDQAIKIDSKNGKGIIDFHLLFVKFCWTCHRFITLV